MLRLCPDGMPKRPGDDADTASGTWTVGESWAAELQALELESHKWCM